MVIDGGAADCGCAATPAAATTRSHTTQRRTPTPACEIIDRTCLHSTKPGCRQCDIGPRPCRLEPRFGERGVGGLVLRTQRLQEAEERPAVLAVALQILPVDRLGLRRPPRLEQHG